MPPKLPPVDDVLKQVGLSSSEIANIHKGDMVKGTKESADERDLAAWFGFLVKDADVSKCREVFITSVARKVDPSVKGMGLIDDDEEVDADDDEGFAGISFGPNGDAIAKEYLSAKPGSSGQLNLSKEEMDKFHALPKGASTSDVEEVVRQVLKGRLAEYKQRGLEGISPYCRGKGKNFEPGKELAHKSSILTVTEKYAPEYVKYLKEYPNSKPDNIDESFTWVNFTSEDQKPNFCLVHKVGMAKEDGYIFCQRHFYVSRGHNTVQGNGGALPVGDNETLIIYVSRTSTDQVTGFGGGAKRTIGARIMGGKIAENMERSRTTKF